MGHKRSNSAIDDRRLLEQAGNLTHWDSVIWIGDMNYRISAHQGKVVQHLIQNDTWEVLTANDQLNIEKAIKRVAYGYNEGVINFAPTYKFKKNTDNYDPKRSAAWTDRILYRSNDRILK